MNLRMVFGMLLVVLYGCTHAKEVKEMNDAVVTTLALRTDSSDIMRMGPDAFALDVRAREWRDVHLKGSEFAVLPLQESFYQPRRTDKPYAGSRHYLLYRLRAGETIRGVVERYRSLAGDGVDGDDGVSILGEAERLHHLHHDRRDAQEGDFCPLILPRLTHDVCAGVVHCQLHGMTVVTF
ncbi:MAG: hypothetical protein HYY50_05170 [Candidatus Kerfeldbacteria bacterium]|nr:hypothetical protein [Candidatus Kerfeldbacteria bacterium]